MIELNKKIKPIIENITISKEKLQELDIMSKSWYAPRSKTLAIRKVAGGVCCVCEKIPSKKVSVCVSDSEGEGVLVEYYCTNCFEKHYKNDNKTKLRDTSGLNEQIFEKEIRKVQHHEGM